MDGFVLGDNATPEINALHSTSQTVSSYVSLVALKLKICNLEYILLFVGMGLNNLWFQHLKL